MLLALENMGSTRQSGNPQLGKHALAVSSKAHGSKGLVDFDDVRLCVAERLMDTNFAGRIGTALAARFREIVVDEAQDCNPSDLAVVHWLRRSGLACESDLRSSSVDFLIPGRHHERVARLRG